MKLSKDFQENCTRIGERIHQCDDIIKREIWCGKRRGYIYFIEVAITSDLLERSVVGSLLTRLSQMTEAEQEFALKRNGLGATDGVVVQTVDEVCDGILAGDAVVILEGIDCGVKIKVSGYPHMGITEAENEVVLRGSKEGFADSIKSNTALIRKRLRTTELKVLGRKIGETSHTNIAIVYLEGKARTSVIDALEKRLQSLQCDGVFDSGVLEQLTETTPHSPFPQYRTTERPDTAAMELLHGCILVLVDNSPVGLLLPCNLSSFFHTPDDYYNRTGVVCLERFLRFLGAFLAMCLPAIYLSMIRFHPEMLPYSLLIKFMEARSDLSFSSVTEVIFMELSFELLREAGVRVPGTMGNTIGIVGGLIIGDAAVSAGLISPIIVIVVSITALSSFAIPNEEMSEAIRLMKYIFILGAALCGFFGILCIMMFLLIHLAKLKSYGFPYLYPFVAGEINQDKDTKDAFFRKSLSKLTHRTLYERK